jgi:hypothetical protein
MMSAPQGFENATEHIRLDSISVLREAIEAIDPLSSVNFKKTGEDGNRIYEVNAKGVVIGSVKVTYSGALMWNERRFV